jgi:hypothetical protein
MNVARSRDGTDIAFERLGGGPPIVLVGGAFLSRGFPKMRQLAEFLAGRFTVINYDRRGRGDSGDTAPYAVEREIEDLAAVIDAAGGAACVWGWSSGGVLALRAAAAGLNIEKVAVYNPPFIVDDSGHLPPPDLAARLDEVTSSGRRGAAVRLFMTKGIGIPPTVVGLMRWSPFWPRLRATALTTPYDLAIMGDTVAGQPLRTKDWAAVTQPALVVAGEKTAPELRKAAEAIADVLPDARHRTLARQGHNVSMPALAPVLEKFFARPGPAQASRLPSSPAWAATPAA